MERRLRWTLYGLVVGFVWMPSIAVIWQSTEGVVGLTANLDGFLAKMLLGAAGSVAILLLCALVTSGRRWLRRAMDRRRADGTTRSMDAGWWLVMAIVAAEGGAVVWQLASGGMDSTVGRALFGVGQKAVLLVVLLLLASEIVSCVRRHRRRRVEAAARREAVADAPECDGDFEVAKRDLIALIREAKRDRLGDARPSSGSSGDARKP